MFEIALKYIMGLLIENEEAQKLPKDFVTASIKWIRSWLLIDDPVAEAVVSLPGNEEAKTKVIETKLAKLLENDQFLQELRQQIHAMQAELEKLPSTVITNTATTGDNNRNTANLQGNTTGGDLNINQS